MKLENKHLSHLLDKDDLENTVPKLEEEFAKQYPGSKLIYLTKTGSILHGTADEESDLDIKGLYLPSIESFLREENIKVLNLSKPKDKKKPSKNEKEDIDLEVFPVNYFLNLLSGKMETNSVEVLFSMFANCVLLETEESRIIKDNYKSLITNSTNSMVKFAISQAIKYSDKGERLGELEDVIKFFEDLELSRPDRKKLALKDLELSALFEEKKFTFPVTLKNNENVDIDYLEVLNRKMIMTSKVGYFMSFLGQIKDTYGDRAETAKNLKGKDYKAFSHAIRAIKQAKELVSKGFITYPSPDVKLLREIKFDGKYNTEELFAMMHKEEDELEAMDKDQVLGDKPDFEKIDQIKVEMYSKRLNP